MKFNKWTVALAAIGVVSLASAARADEQPPKMMEVQTALSNTTLSGYVDTAASWRPGTDRVGASQANQGAPAVGSANTPAYAFAQNDGFFLNAVDIALDKPEDESPWASGYHVELMTGSQAVGEQVGSNGSVNQQTFNQTTIRSAYLRLRTPVGNGIDWQVGVWDTIIGYESSSDPLNPNYTRSYGYTIEPTSHTGILATYKINDMATVQAGIADSSNVGAAGTVGVNPASLESQKAYMGDIQFTAPQSAGWMQGATFTVGAINSAGSSTGVTGTTSVYAGATVPTPMKALKVGMAFDYLDIHNSHSAPAGNPANDSVWVIGFYSSYQATDKLSLNLRAEYLDAHDAGASSAGLFTIPNAATYGQKGAEEFTATLQYQLWANVLSRVEFRWDHVENANAFGWQSGNANPAGAFRSNDFLLALNLIYQF
jgi:hypothetical protein